MTTTTSSWSNKIRVVNTSFFLFCHLNVLKFVNNSHAYVLYCCCCCFCYIVNSRSVYDNSIYFLSLVYLLSSFVVVVVFFFFSFFALAFVCSQLYLYFSDDILTTATTWLCVCTCYGLHYSVCGILNFSFGLQHLETSETS